MPLTKRARIGAVILMALPAISLGLLSALPASASPVRAARPAHPALAPRPAVARPASVPAGAKLVKHNCAVIHVTADRSEESVHCADVWFLSDGDNSRVFGGNEVICQTPAGALRDCVAIEERAQLLSNAFPTRTESGTCGTVLGHSDCGVRRVENVTPSDHELLLESGETCTYKSQAGNDLVTTSDGVAAGGTITTGILSFNC